MLVVLGGAVWMGIATARAPEATKGMGFPS